MAGTTLVRTTLTGVRPLGVRGEPLHATHEQIRGVIRRRLGERHARLLAEPQPDDAGRRIDWYSDVAGEVAPLASLPETARMQTLAHVDTLIADIAALGAQLQQAPSADARITGRALELACRRPSDDYVFMIGEQPVVVCWGYEPEAAGALLPPALPATTPAAAEIVPPPTPVTPAITPLPAPVAAAAVTRVCWLGWVLGGAFAVVLSLMTACVLREFCPKQPPSRCSCHRPRRRWHHAAARSARVCIRTGAAQAEADKPARLARARSVLRQARGLPATQAARAATASTETASSGGKEAAASTAEAAAGADPQAAAQGDQRLQLPQGLLARRFIPLHAAARARLSYLLLRRTRQRPARLRLAERHDLHSTGPRAFPGRYAADRRCRYEMQRRQPVVAGPPALPARRVRRRAMQRRNQPAEPWRPPQSRHIVYRAPAPAVGLRNLAPEARHICPFIIAIASIESPRAIDVAGTNLVRMT